MTSFINLTPHDINVLNVDGNMVTIPASGTVARCSVSSKIVTEVNGINITSVEYGEVMDLPPKLDYVLYVVSVLVRLACPHRYDLVSPGDLIRDENGVVIGCKSLNTN